IASKDYVRSKAGIEPFKANGKRKPAFDIGKIIAAQTAGGGKPRGNIVATYDYRDDTGALLYQVVRLEPKDFRQRQPDGKGGWIWSVKDCRRVVYRLPDLLQFPDACVFVCEGEKDADRVACFNPAPPTAGAGDGTDDGANAPPALDSRVLKAKTVPGAR